MSGKYTRSGKRSVGSRSVFLMLAVVLVIGCTIGGTLAWLTANDDPVTNTFVAGQIGSLTLTETDTNQNETGDQHQYIVIPGVDIVKDPVVTYTPVSAENGVTPVDAYIFLKVTKPDRDSSGYHLENRNQTVGNGKGYDCLSTGNEDPAYAELAFAEGWISLAESGNDWIFYREVPKNAELTNGKLTFSVIHENTITVNHTITVDNVEAVAEAFNGLTFQAYAIQQQGFDTVTAAWNEVSGANTTP